MTWIHRHWLGGISMMNDFTIEDLENINDILKESEEINRNLVINLSNKIQSMIENYNIDELKTEVEK